MLIANPIYDSVFKYLMQDKKAATLLISAILELPVLDLDFSSQEFSSEIKYFSVYRVDFRAKIKTSNGEEVLVLIEIQKIKFTMEDVFRFRKYLGQQYMSKSNVDGKGQPLPIITIYILGHYLEDYHDYPIIRVQRRFIAHGTNEELEKGKSSFIEMLTHDSVVIQIPSLKKKKKKNKKLDNELEKLLDIFELVSKHEIEFNERGFPRRYLPILRRLQKAIAEEELRNKMDIEDEIVEGFKQKESEIEQKEKLIEQKEKELKQEKQRAEQEKLRAEQEKLRAEQEKQRAEQEKIRAEQEKQRAEQEKIRAEQEKITIVRNLLQAGIDKEKVKQLTGVDEEFFKKL